MAGRYGDIVYDKIVILPFVVERVSPYLVTRKNQKFIISHIGAFLKERESSVFIEAIKFLNDRIQNLHNILNIQYIGRVTKKELSLIQLYGLSNIFSIVGTVPEAECGKYFENSDMFLVIDTNQSNNVFFPSKILKYYAYKKPILGIVTPDSVLERELKASRHCVFDYYNSKSIAEFLECVLNAGKVISFDLNYVEKFYPESVMSSYSMILKRISCSAE